jgi:glycosyltransferase involved in cell wall biosynthesis
MKILFVTPYFYPAQYFGGPVQAVLKLGKELAKRNNEIVVYTSDARTLRERLDINFDLIEGIKIYYFKNWLMFPAQASRLFITPELCGNLMSKLPTFDLVYANEYTTYQNIILHKYACKYGVPYVVQARGSIPKIGRTARKTIFNALFGRKLLRDASANIALTKAESCQYKLMGVPAEKIFTIPNGINMAEFDKLPLHGLFRKKYKIPEKKRIILSLGRIHAIKGLDVLVKAFAYGKTKGEFRDTSLVISGSDDGYLEKLRNLVNLSNVSSDVIFAGPLYGEDKLSAYVDSDVFVLPSVYETFPNTVLEAYGCYIPVIASDVESISDIVLDGKTGLLFESGNYKQLSEKISFVLTDPEKSLKMTLAARELVEKRFSIDHVVDLFEDCFEQILSDAKKLGDLPN